MCAKLTDSDQEPLLSLAFGDQHSISMGLNFLQTSVFPVILMKQNSVRSIGTAFAISPHGLCLTAKHVIDDVPLIPNPERPGTLMPDGALGVLYITPPNGDDPPDSDLVGGFIPMISAHTIDGIDIGVLFLNLPIMAETGETLSLPISQLKLDLPAGGERLLAFGYVEGEWCIEDSVNSLKHGFQATTGFVRAIYPAGRDQVLLPTPCFETSACFRPGMSGGPVIDENGLVIGVVSTGFSLADNEAPLSYASPIAAAMGISIKGIDSNGIERLMFLWDFASEKNSAVKVAVGSAKVERTDTELFVRTGGGQYHSILGS